MATMLTNLKLLYLPAIAQVIAMKFYTVIRWHMAQLCTLPTVENLKF